MTVIELKGVFVKYGTKYALQDINLVIEAGSIVGIIGHSGSGKTTILRVIAGFQNYNKGSVEIFGKDRKNAEPSERGVGYIFQNYTLFPHLSVFENIAFGLKTRKTDNNDIKSKVADITSFLNIQNLVGKYPHQLSGGEQQRVAIARSMILEPKILLLDESFSSLDYNLKIELLNQLKRINKERGITIIYVTHDQTDCFGLCDRVVVVNSGAIIESDQTINILNFPKTKEVASFIGIYQEINNKIIKNIVSKKYKFSAKKIYYIKKNKFYQTGHISHDLSISGTISEVANKSLYYLIKVNINKECILEFVSYKDETLKPGNTITLYFSSNDLILFKNEKVQN